MEKFEKLLKCEGYFGFGGGYEMAAGREPGREAYCSRQCPVANACWAKHRARVATIVPAMVEEFEKMAEAYRGRGPELVRKWMEQSGNADPYSIVMMGNLEDGVNVGGGGSPKDRGLATITFPFAVH